MEYPTTCVRTPFDTATLVTTIVFTVVANVFVLLRLFVCHRSPHLTWHLPENWLIVAALVMCYGYTIQTICAVALTGINCYRRDRPLLWSADETDKLLWTDLFLLTPASGLVKISILEFYKRIFVTRYFHWLCNILIFVISGWMIATVITSGFTSTPVSDSWHVATTDVNRNYNYPDFALAIFGIDIGLDLLVLCLPISEVVKLRMSWSKKAKVISIFYLGAFCLVCSAVRFYYAERSMFHAFANPGQAAYIVGRVAMWGRMEPSVSIIAACLPALAPLMPSGHSLHSLISQAKSRLSSRSGSKISGSQKSVSSADNSIEKRESNGSGANTPPYWNEVVQDTSQTNHLVFASSGPDLNIEFPVSADQLSVTQEADEDRTL